MLAAKLGFEKAAGKIMGRLFAGVDPYEGGKAIYYAIERGSNTITKLKADAEWLSLVGDITKMSTADRKALTESFEQIKKFMNASKHMDEETRLKFLYRLTEERAGGEGAFENLMTGDVKAWKPKSEYQVAAEKGLDEAHKDLRSFKDQRASDLAELRPAKDTRWKARPWRRIKELRDNIRELEGHADHEGLIKDAQRKVYKAEDIANPGWTIPRP